MTRKWVQKCRKWPNVLAPKEEGTTYLKNQKSRETLRHPSIFSACIIWVYPSPFSLTLSLSLSLSFPPFWRNEQWHFSWFGFQLFSFLIHSSQPPSLSPPSLSSPTSLSCPALNSKPYCCCPQIQPFFNHPHLGSGEFSLFDSFSFLGFFFFFPVCVMWLWVAERVSFMLKLAWFDCCWSFIWFCCWIGLSVVLGFGFYGWIIRDEVMKLRLFLIFVCLFSIIIIIIYLMW